MFALNLQHLVLLGLGTQNLKQDAEALNSTVRQQICHKLELSLLQLYRSRCQKHSHPV